MNKIIGQLQFFGLVAAVYWTCTITQYQLSCRLSSPCEIHRDQLFYLWKKDKKEENVLCHNNLGEVEKANIRKKSSKLWSHVSVMYPIKSVCIQVPSTIKNKIIHHSERLHNVIGRPFTLPYNLVLRKADPYSEGLIIWVCLDLTKTLHKFHKLQFVNLWFWEVKTPYLDALSSSWSHSFFK